MKKQKTVEFELEGEMPVLVVLPDVCCVVKAGDHTSMVYLKGKNDPLRVFEGYKEVIKMVKNYHGDIEPILQDPNAVTVTKVIVNHYQKFVDFRTLQGRGIVPFESYDEWGTLNIAHYTFDVHVYWYEDLKIYLEPLMRHPDGTLGRVSLGRDLSVCFEMDDELVEEVGEPKEIY